MRLLRTFGIVAMAGGGLLAVAAIAYAGYVRMELLPNALRDADPSPIYLLRLAWGVALGGLAAALAGSLLVPRADAR